MVRDRTVPSLATTRDLAMDWLHEGATDLAVDVVGFHISTHVRLRVSDFAEVPGPIPAGRVELVFSPTSYGPLAPAVGADLEIQSVADRATLLTLLADYRPPYGAAGTVADRVLMHRVAEAGLRRFFAGLLRDIRSHPAEQEAMPAANSDTSQRR